MIAAKMLEKGKAVVDRRAGALAKRRTRTAKKRTT
jgi:hypothetical protein